MAKRVQILACITVDFLTINITWMVYFHLRVQTRLLGAIGTPDFLAPMLVLWAYWAIVFTSAGLYKPLYAASRSDEFLAIFKAVSLGCLLLFFVIFIDDAGTGGTSTRMLMLIYWGILVLLSGTGRALVRSVQKRLLIAGIGARRTVIVGSRTRSLELFDQVKKYPALGYELVGFVGIHPSRWGGSQRGIPVLGAVSDFGAIIKEHHVHEALIALDSREHERLLEILGACNGTPIGLKIMPDLYDIISGQARTNQIYGFPLIAISPELMKPWEEMVKRALDLVFSLLVLVVGLPFWLLIAAAVKLESRGPVFYLQERVGRDGEHFNIVKFRSMHHNAESGGPQWAEKRDPRVTRMGKWLRVLHLDEVPQVLNVLKGEMSLIGPRPERPVFVEQLAKEIPLYMRRLRVRPGVTGWAQVKHKYDENVEDVRKKVQYDLYYIENMSFSMDLKIIIYTLVHMLSGKGQ
jgi:exopolysaccharide biosynthesis polyprenyl glycosylphosphotransferase